MIRNGRVRQLWICGKGAEGLAAKGASGARTIELIFNRFILLNHNATKKILELLYTSRPGRWNILNIKKGTVQVLKVFPMPQHSSACPTVSAIRKNKDLEAVPIGF